MTVESTLAHGLAKSLFGSQWKTEYDQNMELLDRNRITAGLLSARPSAGKAERFYFATDTGEMFYDDGGAWLATAVSVSLHAPSHESGGSDAIGHDALSGAGSNSHAQIDSHIAASAPHSGHERTASKGQVNGYASLDGAGKVPDAQIDKDTAQFNADRIKGVTVDDTLKADGKILKYSATSGNLEYQDDASSGSGSTFSQQASAPTSMAQNDSVTVTHPSLSGKEGKAIFQALEFKAGAASQNTTDIIANADIAKWDLEDVKGGISTLTVDTADTSGHFDAAKGAKVLAGCHVKISTGETLKVISITGDGTGTDSVVFAGTITTGAKTVSGIYGLDIPAAGAEQDKLSLSSSTQAFSDSCAEGNGNAEQQFHSGVYEHQGQTFTTSTAVLFTSAKFYIKVGLGSPTGNMYAKIYASDGTKPTGAVLETSAAVSCGVLTGSYALIEFTFSGSTYRAAGNYAVVLEYAGGNSSNCPYTKMDTTTPTHGGNYFYANSASSPSYVVQAGYDFVFYVYGTSASYPTGEYYAAATNGGGQRDTTTWADINSGSVTETLNGETAYYAVSFDGRTTWKVWTGSEWRPIVRNNAGTWEYNNSATSTPNWVSATVNGQNAALSEGMGTSQNRMTGSGYGGISDADWNAAGGFDSSQTTLDWGVVLKSASAAATPAVSDIDANYDLDGNYQARSIGTEAGSEFLVERLSDTTTRFTKKHSGAAANVYCTVVT